jgi:putative inorganic carbon (hco3(-)) transporter
LLHSKNIKWILGITLLFILANAVCFYYEFYYLNLLPVALLIILLALFSIDKLVLFIVFMIPLSVNLQHLEGGLGLSLPAEPLIFGVFLLFILKQIHQFTLDSKFIKHPVTIAIIVNLIWITLTTITSEIPLVSFKFLISRMWFVITFYFVCSQMFKKESTIYNFFWLYIVSFTLVIFYTIYNHYLFGFEEEPANYVMTPFYNDHTVYGAMLAMYLPLLIYFSFGKIYEVRKKVLAILFLLIFIVALVFSYTRAAWLSLAAAAVIYLIMLLRIKYNTLLLVFSIGAIVALIYRTDIVLKLEKNRQDASQEFDEHIESISNISTDASNLERLNRWSAALRMFEQKPFMGWGPGTYSFEYAPFQHVNEKTIISTNAGNKGNAHSEYLGPLSESGVLGLVTFVIILLTVLATAFRLFYTLTNRKMKYLILSVTIGLFTYIVHGVLNNFLDTDKASAPFWGFIAIIVATDLYYSKNNERLSSDENLS